jgi:large subunit ribosomal protein L17
MRHRKAGRKLSRKSPHRKAMFSNMVASLVQHGRIETTDAKAKELRSIAEPAITWAVSVSELKAHSADTLAAADRARVVHAMRMAKRVVKNPEALRVLFDEVGPRFRGRPGGYTRILKTRNRHGDSAPMSFVELVPGEGAAPAAAKSKAAKAEK